MNQKDIVAVTSRSFSKNASLVDELNKLYYQVFLNETGKTLKDDELINFLKIASKAIVGIEDMSANTLAQLPNLRVISKYGVGLNNIDLEFCKSSGIRLGFIPGVNKQSVAEAFQGLSRREIHGYQVFTRFEHLKGFTLVRGFKGRKCSPELHQGFS